MQYNIIFDLGTKKNIFIKSTFFTFERKLTRYNLLIFYEEPHLNNSKMSKKKIGIAIQTKHKKTIHIIVKLILVNI